MATDHYENFPVASLLLPAHLRPAVDAIYAFARSADDLADEGDASPGQRLAALAAYDAELDRIAAGTASVHPMFIKLGHIISSWPLPLTPFRELLSAFQQDVVTTHYPDFPTLLDYCRRSANPVGALMLQLYRADSRPARQQSDAICSALQLINFWQDVAIDWEKSRIYLPQDDMARFGVTQEHLEAQRVDPAWRALMAFEVARARALLRSGAPLALQLPGRIGWELRLVVQGGLRILELIEAADFDVFRRRPQLRRRDWMLLAWRAVRMQAEPVTT
ncbi:squalene synthase HpnC [Actimicrobium sp. GrIS 1.19]|uniref:squalene synthase HpnC n=1 Tax=Actimicrobium sp. GrIS 1.19 TaxID=3071708 RepID=UPI002DF960A2|nr:squalene synthase HpnC [Actimicrobium sp. GrIS 1.19]